MNPRKHRIYVPLALCAIATASCPGKQPRSGSVIDEAQRVGREATSFPAADEDYFHDMDGKVSLSPDEVKGRNTWLVWSGGNDRLWDVLSQRTVDYLDFLKILSSHPALKHGRDDRWSYAGLINE